MISTLNPSIKVSQGAINYYRGNYIFGAASAAVLYYVACQIWKIKNAGKRDEYDFYGTFDEKAASRKGITPFQGLKGEGAADDEDVLEEARHGEVTFVDGLSVADVGGAASADLAAKPIEPVALGRTDAQDIERLGMTQTDAKKPVLTAFN